LLKCLEEWCEYINNTAFAFMAITGDSFCQSALNGFLLNVKHGVKFATANFLAQMFILLGKIGVTVINCFSLYLIMKYITKDTDEVSSITGPVSIVALASYMTASIFLGLFDESVLAMLNCLCVDIDLNGDPLFGPPTFHEKVEQMSNIKSQKVGDNYG
jgi:hypothetical protein